MTPREAQRLSRYAAMPLHVRATPAGRLMAQKIAASHPVHDDAAEDILLQDETRYLVEVEAAYNALGLRGALTDLQETVAMAHRFHVGLGLENIDDVLADITSDADLDAAIGGSPGTPA